MHEVFEHYAEQTKISMVVDEHDSAQNKFWTRGKTKTIIRSYIEDIRSRYKSHIKQSETTLPPSGRQRNRIAYLRVDGKPLLGAIEFDDQITHNFHTDIERGARCKVTHCIDNWVLGHEEPNCYAPVRYTQRLTLSLHNCLNKPIKVKISARNQTSEITLSAGEKERLLDTRDIKPEEEVYSFTISIG